MGKINNVLFLCSGNTSRSPAAEYIAKWLKQAKYENELKDVKFDSAGLYSYYKYPQEGTANYLKSKDINFSDFQGKKINIKLVKKQDLILGFEEKWHIRKLIRRFKNLKDLDKKAFLLQRFVGEKNNFEIPDPINFKPEKYYQVLVKIEDAVEKALKKIIEINKSSSRDGSEQN